MKGDSPGGCWPDAASCGGASRGRLWWYWMNTGCVSAMCCAMARTTLPMSGSNEWWDVGCLVSRSAPSSLAALSLSDVCRLRSPNRLLGSVATPHSVNSMQAFPHSFSNRQARLVGQHDRSRQSVRHEPVLRNLLQRVGRMPRHYRTFVAQSRHRLPVRHVVSRDHHRLHGAPAEIG